LTLATAEGAEILLHIGIDTVELNGRGFTPKVAQGAHVHTGDLLIEFDQDLVACNAPSLVSVIAVANSRRVRDRRARWRRHAEGRGNPAAAIASARRCGSGSGRAGSHQRDRRSASDGDAGPRRRFACAAGGTRA
jgi:hypothetical protein